MCVCVTPARCVLCTRESFGFSPSDPARGGEERGVGGTSSCLDPGGALETAKVEEDTKTWRKLGD